MSSTEKLSRRKSREAGFLIIFEYSFRQAAPLEIAQEAKFSHDLDYDEYSIAIAEGVVENIEQIDSIILTNLKNWTIERISRISLAVLRCSIYEFYIGKLVDVEISINEAVELVKKYSMPEDASFVNGILGTIARSNNDNENESINETAE